uniref:Uncharacterized protein n=1 Tax=Utricularia reniformis TaxID=192314 RepID=A0A1Y0B0I0_9LAMI|nr:hypothetical protein AEK19_MT0626 [Utricularia reniformis]ART30881.1 hypothetical protein AEK19_MT0626 [Utricularia reniformis]
MKAESSHLLWGSLPRPDSDSYRTKPIFSNSSAFDLLTANPTYNFLWICRLRKQWREVLSYSGILFKSQILHSRSKLLPKKLVITSSKLYRD